MRKAKVKWYTLCRLGLIWAMSIWSGPEVVLLEDVYCRKFTMPMKVPTLEVGWGGAESLVLKVPFTSSSF